jgi:hypothetical protein
MGPDSIALFSYEHRPFPDYDPRQVLIVVGMLLFVSGKNKLCDILYFLLYRNFVGWLASIPLKFRQFH